MYKNRRVNQYDLSAAQYKAERRQNQCTLTAVKLSFIIKEKKKKTKAVNVATANVTFLFIKSIDDACLSKNVCKVTMYAFFDSDSDGNF